MGKMSVDVEKRENDPLLKISGEIGKGDTEEFRSLMENSGDQCKSRLYLDLSKLTGIDSMGLGIMIYNYSYLKNSGRELVILDPSDEMRELLEISCLDKLITII